MGLVQCVVAGLGVGVGVGARGWGGGERAEKGEGDTALWNNYDQVNVLSVCC